MLAGCAGATFHLAPKLAAAPHETVTGPRYSARCANDEHRTGIEKLHDGATIHDGDVTLVVSAAHVVENIRDEVPAHVFKDLGRIQKILAGSAHGARFTAADLRDPRHSPDALVTGLIACLHVFVDASENARFSFVARVKDREVAGICRSVDHATTLGVFNPPDFRLTCGLASQDGKVRKLRIRGAGSWVNYSFDGTLSGGARPWIIKSQNISVMGMGEIRGFEIRGRRGGHQIGAVSFQERGPRDAHHHSTVVAKAWHLPAASRDDDDALRSALTLLYAYPWPTACDRQVLVSRDQ